MAQPEDAGVIRVDEDTGIGVAMAVDGNGRFTALDPYAGAQLALAESYRNVAVVGARPLAVTNCLNFGSPQDPGVMWQFEQTTAGLADGCRILGLPVTGGNVSFYNQTGGSSILPTPVVGVLGRLEDVSRRITQGFRVPGQQIYLLGTTHEEISGSEWAAVVHRHLGGVPPRVDLGAEQMLADALQQAANERLIKAAHDLSDGGLAQALVESCLRNGFGAQVRLPDQLDPFVALFSESAGRVIVSVNSDRGTRLNELCAAHGIPCTHLGAVDMDGGHAALDVDGLFMVALEELRSAWSTTIPAAMADGA